MAYAATPAATPAAETPAPAEEGRAPPTIDSHGGKLPLTSSYLPQPSSTLILLAILSVLAPRRLKAFGGTQLGWTRLIPGLLLTAVMAWNLLPSPQPFSSPELDYYQWVTVVVTGTVLAFTFLNLLSDALLPMGRPSTLRGLLSAGAAALGLLVAVCMSAVDWWGLGPTPEFTVHLVPPAILLAGLPCGLALIFLWRRITGWGFEVAVALGTPAVLVVGSLLGDHFRIYDFAGSLMGAVLLALTVAASGGFALKAMGKPGWQDLSGRALWAWAWVLRAFVVASAASVGTF